MPEIEPSLLAAVRNHVGHLTLNRPAGLNALTLSMVRELQHQLQTWAADPEIFAVVLRSASEKAFCAGGDIRSLYDSFQAGQTLHEAFFVEEYALDQFIHNYPKPVVALMDGFVLGGGMGLAQGAALRVVTERARLGMPEVAIGYFPDVGGSHFLPRLPGQLGIYLGVTGNQLGPADALYAHLADWCLPSELIPEFDRCLDHMGWTTLPQESLRTLLATLASDKLPGAELQRLRPVIDEHFSLPDLLSIRQALTAERRPEYVAWAAATLAVLSSRSPLAMCVTLELLRTGRTLSLSDCFALEMHLDRQWFAKGDIVEGVRALLIDKDKRPRWNPETIEAVSAAQVQAFFQGFSASSKTPRYAASAWVTP
jgi:enoyl-CoA hydratase/carnithine racemase